MIPVTYLCMHLPAKLPILLNLFITFTFYRFLGQNEPKSLSLWVLFSCNTQQPQIYFSFDTLLCAKQTRQLFLHHANRCFYFWGYDFIQTKFILSVNSAFLCLCAVPAWASCDVELVAAFSNSSGLSHLVFRMPLLLSWSYREKKWRSCREWKKQGLSHRFIYILAPQRVGPVIQPHTLCLVFSSTVVIFWAAMSHSRITHFDRVRKKKFLKHAVGLP